MAVDHSPLQDFCIAESSNQVLLNGLACKKPSMFQASDFSFSGLHIAGLNTLGISLVRIDYAPWGVNPPHTHPRATEIFTLVKGNLEVGFVTSNPNNCLISKILNKGDVFVFPIGLVHYQRNVGSGNAMAIAGLSSQNPGVITTANAVFGSKPDISTDILVRAFQLAQMEESKSVPKISNLHVALEHRLQTRTIDDAKKGEIKKHKQTKQTWIVIKEPQTSCKADELTDNVERRDKDVDSSSGGGRGGRFARGRGKIDSVRQDDKSHVERSIASCQSESMSKTQKVLEVTAQIKLREKITA
ncbi:hypothetical protein POM88_035192 [Heracleum sosnowskyi]|uniref:Germin-like protein n=1 Tax=Heracleum sosnowskyi TaxID=360622 RepID=A0AAD8HMZ7_9APIA|nr:hypothetical protein POM88_035192 [Heracleum sosnowskyi]